MHEPVSRVLASWQGFYRLLGAAAAALIGIQVVVMTLIANMGRATTVESVSAFATSTLLQLVDTLLVSVFINFPCPSVPQVQTPLLAGGGPGGTAGLGGHGPPTHA